MASENPEIYNVLIKVIKPQPEYKRRYETHEPPEKFFKTFEKPEKVIDYASSLDSHLTIEKIIKLDQYANVTHMTIVFKGKLELTPTLSTASLGDADKVGGDK